MKSFCGLILFSSLVMTGAAQAGESTGFEQPGHWECRSSPPQDTVYFSAIFDLQTEPAEIGTAFAQMLLSKYGYRGQTSCSMAYISGSTLAKLQGDQQSYVAQLRQSGIKAVQTGWVFVPANASLPHFCWGIATESQGTTRSYSYYSTDVFHVPAGVMGKMSTQWLSYLQGLRPGAYINPAGCVLLAADPAKHQAVTDATRDMYKSHNPQIIHVDWKYTPGQASAPAIVPPTPNAAGASVPSSASTDVSTTATAQPVIAPGQARPPAANAAQSPIAAALNAPFYICQFNLMQPGGKPVYYSTDVFASTTSYVDINSAWKSYAQSTYHLPNPNSAYCTRAGAPAPGQPSPLDTLKQALAPSNLEVIEVNWKG